jgi:transposase-like protein
MALRSPGRAWKETRASSSRSSPPGRNRYLRYSLSLRDVEELLEERGLQADHTTVWRWVQRYGTELEQRLRRHLKPTNKSWRVDETYFG